MPLLILNTNNRSEEPNRYGRAVRISPMPLLIHIVACESISNDIFRFLGIIVRRISVHQHIVVKLNPVEPWFLSFCFI
jgi:hypothetical protein